MTHRERMLATIRGEPTDQIPWVPRMDLWCIAQRARGTLPKQFVGLNTAQIADVLGVACHSVRGDFTLQREPGEFALRGFGIENHPDFPYRVELRGLPMEFRQEGDSSYTRIRTSAGDIEIHLNLTNEMRREGISMPFVKQFAIRSEADFDAIGEIYEHLEVMPTPEAYESFHKRLGHRGLAIANGMMGASPMHAIFHDIVLQEQFFYLYADEREGLERLARRMEPFFEKVLDTVMRCKAEVVFWGCNYDQDLTWPAFFKDQIAPWLKKAADRAHAAGKFLLTHTDGENQKLLPLYPTCSFDVAESVCPKPMTRCSLKEVREGMGPKITVFGGLCSVAFLKDSMNDVAFESYLDQTFVEIGTGERLILGVSDMVPPDADMKRLEQIKERVRS